MMPDELAGKVGFEPTYAESESAVLPLDDFPRISMCHSSGVPDGIRTRVFSLKGRCLRPGWTTGTSEGTKWRSCRDLNPGIHLEKVASWAGLDDTSV